MTTWTRYLNGPDGLARLRKDLLRYRDGTGVPEALARDPFIGDILAAADDPETRLLYVDATRGTGKTTNAAGLIALPRLVLRRDHDVFVVANDRDQARILAREAAGFVQRDPILRRTCQVHRNAIACQGTGSLLQVLAADAIGSYGFGARSFTAIIDEFWGHTDRALFDALWSAVPKTPGSQVIILTNAGPDRAGIAWEIRELCRTSKDPALRFWASAEHGVVPSWIDPAEIERQRRTLPPSVFARLWEGEWGHGSGDFLTREDVESCIDETLSAHSLQFADDLRYYLGVDLGLKHDRSVVAVAHRERETLVVDHLATWYGSPERPVSLEDVLAHVAMLGRRIRHLRRGLLDPWQGAMLLERARRSGVRTLDEYTFTPANLQTLSQALWGSFKGRSIRIPPHGELVDELVTARVVEKRYGWRLDHQSGGFSDHAMAVGLALVAALPDPGDRIVSNERHDELIGQLRERIPDPRRFGFRRRLGLQLVSTDPTPRLRTASEFHAELRLLQLLDRGDRISRPERESLEQTLREELQRRPRVARELANMTDTLEHELGNLDDEVARILAPRNTERSTHV